MEKLNLKPDGGPHTMPNQHTLDALSARDKALNEQTKHLKDTIPEGWEDQAWEEPKLPAREHFTIREGSTGSEYGPFQAEDFVIDPETNIASAHYQPIGETRHIPFVLRCLLQHNNLLECVRDDGIRTLYHLHVPIDNTLEEPEIEL